jgi:dihydrofolate reductase
MISIIVAIAENYAIGKNNHLLWHIPEDLKRFKKITSGHKIIMGKRTYLSLPFRPLRNRENIVITDKPGEKFEGCTVVYSIEEAFGLCRDAEEIFIIGGASVYKQFLPNTNRLYITWVHKNFEGDVFFPKLDLNEWKIISEENFPVDDLLGFSYSYVIYERRQVAI